MVGTYEVGFETVRPDLVVVGAAGVDWTSRSLPESSSSFFFWSVLSSESVRRRSSSYERDRA